MSTPQKQSDRELRKTVRECKRTLERLASLDVQKAVREGRADLLLAEGERAVAAARAASDELRRRESPTVRSRQRLPESLTGIIPTRNRVRSGSHPAAAALRVVATFGHPELIGATLTAGNLNDEEGAELAALVKQARKTGEQLSDERRGRYERLLGRCAGNESLFAERRREAAARKKLGELTKEAKLAALPQRVKYEEPGAVVLPAFVFEWLKSSRDASWTLADTGMLAAVLGMFANRDAGLIIGAHFETDDGGGDVLVAPEDVIFRPDTNPHPMQGGAGQVNPAVALATLRRTGWITVERRDGRFRIGLLSVQG
jgi:hypothetical protein